MKYITFTVPAYNSEAYLNKCIDSLLVAGSDVEIIIVNDGSKDNTLSIAKAYQKNFPDIVKVIDKENGGHGSGVNAGLKHATGLFFKVVDSDDWLDAQALLKLIQTIKLHHQKHIEVDMYIANFTYAHQFEKHTIRDYSKKFPKECVFGWDQVKKFKYSMTLLMHALIHNTDKLRQSGVELPNHTFYVDNIFVYDPLPFINRMYYLPVSLYQYYIGRSDQSVTLKNISLRYEQQIRVMKHITDQYSYNQLDLFSKNMKSYMLHHISAMMIITQMFTVSKDSKERRENMKQMWYHIKEKDVHMFRYLRYRSFNLLVNFLPWRIKGFVMVKGYLYFKKKYKLG